MPEQEAYERLWPTVEPEPSDDTDATYGDFWADFDKLAVSTPIAPPVATKAAEPLRRGEGFLQNFSDSVYKGFSNLGGLGLGVTAIAATLSEGLHEWAGAESVAAAAERVATRAIEIERSRASFQGEFNPPEIAGFGDIGGVGDALMFATEAIGEQLPILIPTLAGAGAGGKGAQLLAKGATQRLLARKTGQYVGAWSASSALNAGSIFHTVEQATGQRKPGLALGFGAIAGVGDVVTDVPIFRGLAGQAARRGVGGTAKFLARQAGLEFLTEAGQEVLEQHAIGVTDPQKAVPWVDVWKQAASAGGRAAIAAGGISAVSSAVGAVRGGQDAFAEMAAEVADDVQRDAADLSVAEGISIEAATGRVVEERIVSQENMERTMDAVNRRDVKALQQLWAEMGLVAANSPEGFDTTKINEAMAIVLDAAEKVGLDITKTGATADLTRDLESKGMTPEEAGPAAAQAIEGMAPTTPDEEMGPVLGSLVDEAQPQTDLEDIAEVGTELGNLHGELETAPAQGAEIADEMKALHARESVLEDRRRGTENPTESPQEFTTFSNGLIALHVNIESAAREVGVAGEALQALEADENADPGDLGELQDRLRDAQDVLSEEIAAKDGYLGREAAPRAEEGAEAPAAQKESEAQQELDIVQREIAEGREAPIEEPAEAVEPEPAAQEAGDIGKQFPKAGEVVDGRRVGGNVPNQASIEATLDNPVELPGIREVPFEAFTLDEEAVSTDPDILELADQIRESGEIAPLIVAVDEKGPYILEGAHRFDALKVLGAKSFPALVVTEQAQPTEGAPTTAPTVTPTEPTPTRRESDKKAAPTEEALPEGVVFTGIQPLPAGGEIELYTATQVGDGAGFDVNRVKGETIASQLAAVRERFAAAEAEAAPAAEEEDDFQERIRVAREEEIARRRAAEPEGAPEPARPTAQPKAQEARVEEKPPRKSAERLRKVAEGLAGQVAERRAPSTQNVTARRARIAQGRGVEADRLEQIQQIALGIADGIEEGTLPEVLAKVTTRAQIEELTRTTFPTPYAHQFAVRELFQDLKGKPGLPAIRRALGHVSERGNLTKRQVEAIRALVKLARKHKISTTYLNINIAGADRLAKAGITAENFEEARKAALALSEGPSPEVTKAREIKKAEDALIGVKAPGFFPTPRPTVDRMLAAAQIEEGMSVLEPSAGKGDIADVIRETVPEADLSVVEVSRQLQEVLELKGHDLVGDDFLEYSGKHDRIVMNPPFEKGQDIDHVRHAFELLNPGGRVVAIMSEGPFTRSDKKSVAFREWFEDVVGESEKLPAGSFTGVETFRQTGVAARLVTIDKGLAPAAEQPQATTEEAFPEEGPAEIVEQEEAPQEPDVTTEEIAPKDFGATNKLMTREGLDSIRTEIGPRQRRGTGKARGRRGAAQIDPKVLEYYAKAAVFYGEGLVRKGALKFRQWAIALEKEFQAVGVRVPNLPRLWRQMKAGLLKVASLPADAREAMEDSKRIDRIGAQLELQRNRVEAAAKVREETGAAPQTVDEVIAAFAKAEDAFITGATPTSVFGRAIAAGTKTPAKSVKARIERAAHLDLNAKHQEIADYTKAVLPAADQKTLAPVLERIGKTRTPGEMRRLVRAINSRVDVLKKQAAVKDLRGTLKALRSATLEEKFRTRVDDLMAGLQEKTSRPATIAKMQSLLDATQVEPHVTTGEIPSRAILEADAVLKQAAARESGDAQNIRALSLEEINTLDIALQRVLHEQTQLRGQKARAAKRKKVRLENEASALVRKTHPKRISSDPVDRLASQQTETAIGKTAKIVIGGQPSHETQVIRMFGDNSIVTGHSDTFNTVHWDLRMSEEGVETDMKAAVSFLQDALAESGISLEELETTSAAVQQPARWFAKEASSVLRRTWQRLRGVGGVVPGTKAKIVNVSLPEARKVTVGAGGKPVAGARVASIEMTQMEMADIVYMMQDGYVRAKVFRRSSNGIRIGVGKDAVVLNITPKDYAAILGQMDSRYVKFAKIAATYWAENVRDPLNATAREVYGHDIALRKDTHVPIKVDVKINKDINPDQAAAEFADARLENSGITKRRVGGTQPIIVGDLFQAFLGSAKEHAAFIHKTIPVRNATQLLGSAKVRSAFDEAFEGNKGREILNTMLDVVADVEGTRRVEKSGINKLANALINSIQVAVLGAKLHIIGYQVVSFNTLTAEMDVKDVARSALIGPDTIKAEIAWRDKHNPILAARAGGSAQEIITPGSGTAELWNTIGLKPSGPLRGILLADGQPVLRAQWIARQEAARKGLKGDAAIRYIVDRSVQAVDRTQPAFHPLTMSEISRQARKDPLLKLAGAIFTSARSQNANVMMRAWIRFSQSKKTVADRARLAKDIIVQGVNAVQIQLIRQGYATAIGVGSVALARALGREDLKEPEFGTFGDILKQSGVNFLGNFPIIGDAIEKAIIAIDGIVGGKNVSRELAGRDSILAGTLSDIGQGIYRISKNISKGAKGQEIPDTEIERSVIQFLSGISQVTGFPLQGLLVPVKPALRKGDAWHGSALAAERPIRKLYNRAQGKRDKRGKAKLLDRRMTILREMLDNHRRAETDKIAEVWAKAARKQAGFIQDDIDKGLF